MRKFSPHCTNVLVHNLLPCIWSTSLPSNFLQLNRHIGQTDLLLWWVWHNIRLILLGGNFSLYRFLRPTTQDVLFGYLINRTMSKYFLNVAAKQSILLKIATLTRVGSFIYPSRDFVCSCSILAAVLSVGVKFINVILQCPYIVSSNLLELWTKPVVYVPSVNLQSLLFDWIWWPNFDMQMVCPVVIATFLY